MYLHYAGFFYSRPAADSGKPSGTFPTAPRNQSCASRASPTGPAGTAQLGAFGTFVSTTPRLIAPGCPIDLDAALGTPVNMRFTAGDSAVTVAKSGTYLIHYSVNYTAGAGAIVKLLHNGAPVPHSKVCALAKAGEVSGMAIVALDACDTVAIGTACCALTLAANTNAFLTLTRIGA